MYMSLLQMQIFFQDVQRGIHEHLFKFDSVAIEKSLYDGDHVAMYSAVPYVREHCEEMFSLNEPLGTQLVALHIL